MKYTIFLACLVFSLNVLSQETPEDILTPFFKQFETNPDDAIDYIFSTNPYINKNQQGIEQLKERFNTSRKLLGDYFGYEIIEKDYIGESFSRYMFMLKYHRQPVKLEIILYRPDQNWLLYTMQFKDNILENFNDTTD
jgi:hypothetical protein